MGRSIKKEQEQVTKHLYVHPYKPADSAGLQVSALENTIQDSMARVLPALGLRALLRLGQRRVILNECPMDERHCTPTDEPDRYPLIVKERSLYCEPGGHEITIRQLLVALGLKPVDLHKALPLLGSPELVRSYVFETAQGGVESRVVGVHPHRTIGELALRDDDVARGIVIESASVDMASQLSGQPSTRKKMNWCEDVAVHPNGEIGDIRWHGAWLTQLERLLLREQEARDIADHQRRQSQELRAFEASRS